jgi:hypothetical protein
MEVVEAPQARGPASVVQIVEHAGMAQAAELLVSRLGLSGFCGFDFLLDDNGREHLIEMNPRVTPTSYLLVEGDFHRARRFSLFPKELLRDSNAATQTLDAPLRSPGLMRRGEAIAGRHNRKLTRAMRELSRRVASLIDPREG